MRAFIHVRARPTCGRLKKEKKGSNYFHRDRLSRRRRAGHLVESTISIVTVQRVPPRPAARDRQPNVIDNANVYRLRVDVSHFEASSMTGLVQLQTSQATRKTSAFPRDLSEPGTCAYLQTAGKASCETYSPGLLPLFVNIRLSLISLANSARPTLNEKYIIQRIC